MTDKDPREDQEPRERPKVRVVDKRRFRESDGPSEGAGAPSEEPRPELPPETLADLEDELRQATQQAQEYRDHLQRLQAEFDNYRKRVAREQEAIVSFGNERILLAILPFFDNLERAISQSQSAGSAEALLAGVRMIYDQALAELRKFGLEQISAVGEPFDPTLHEAIARVPWEGKPEGTVLAESRMGYLLNGRLLRPAQVTVSHGVPEGEPPDREEGDGHGRDIRESDDGQA